MRVIKFCLALAMVPSMGTLTLAQDLYPELRPLPLTVYGNRHYGQRLLTIAEKLQEDLVFKFGETSQIKSMYVLKHPDQDGLVICGRVIAPAGAIETKFVGLDETVRWNASEEGWRKMGCETPGGSSVSTLFKPGSRIELRIPAPAKISAPASRANIASIPPIGTLPPAVRQRLAFGYEDRLSQILGMQVNLLSWRSYKEQDGSETTCTVGLAGKKRFRIANAGDGEMVTDPSEPQWVAAGCTRPGYQLLR